MAQAEEDKDKKSRFQLYSVVLEAKDYTEPLAAGAKFDKSEYYAHPERYRCTFREKVLILISYLVPRCCLVLNFSPLVSLVDYSKYCFIYGGLIAHIAVFAVHVGSSELRVLGPEVPAPRHCGRHP